MNCLAFVDSSRQGRPHRDSISKDDVVTRDDDVKRPVAMPPIAKVAWTTWSALFEAIQNVSPPHTAMEVVTPT